MDKIHKTYTNLQNISMNIKSEMDSEDINYSIVKEEVEVGPTVLQERHIDTVLIEVSKFEIIEGSANIQFDNNNTFAEDLLTCDTSCSYKAKSKIPLEKHELSHSKIKKENQQTRKVKHKRVCNNQNVTNEVKQKAVYHCPRVNTTWNALYTKSGKLRSYKCDQCPYRTSVKFELNRHRRIHTGRKLFECSQCDYKTPFKSRHTRHQTVHTGVRSFSCDICDFKAAIKTTLIRHLRTHAPNPIKHTTKSTTTFKCDECEKQFTCNAVLKIHLRTHTGELPFWCAHCDFKAIDRRMLVRHINNHTGWKPYSCELCGIRYKGSESVRRHRKKYHGEKL